MSNKACMYSSDCHSVVLRPFLRVDLPSGFAFLFFFFFLFFLPLGILWQFLYLDILVINAFRFENIFVLYLVVSNSFTTHSFGLSSLFFFHSLKAIAHSLLLWLVLDEISVILALVAPCSASPNSPLLLVLLIYYWFWLALWWILAYPSCVLASSLLSVLELQH